MEGITQFLGFVGSIKRLKRAGWLRHIDSRDAESVGDHSFGVAAHFLALSDKDLCVNGQCADRSRCIMMALTHDLAESIVGDITPQDPVTPKEKAKREGEAIRTICSSLEKTRANELIELWEEYERGHSAEAQLVKDADKFDMIVQAYDYEQRYGVSLEEFFVSTETVFKTDTFKALSRNLRDKRNTWINSKP
ncbi:HD domain-containing protein 2 [Cyclospora cayetanensis]|uniref:5'-deoxynucleotidase n=2 Tax=Cyclospora cayetanensis TaxID=88456 RepID=A0A1D3CYZ7_9EIME|nr:HD domain-containing protein 2 [Cyclospora cayetanensis]OEH76427.1 hd domain-containing protein [Cyclospora cayetanensis]